MQHVSLYSTLHAMMQRRLACLLFVLAAIPAFGQQKIQPFEPTLGMIDLNGDNWSNRFEAHLPDRAVGFFVTIEDAQTDLDIIVYTKDGEELIRSEFTDFNERLVWFRNADQIDGDALIDVEITYQYDSLPRIQGRRASAVPYRVTYEPAVPELHPELVPGETVREVLMPEDLMTGFFQITVPRGTEQLRIDLFDTTSDLDLFVSRASIPTDPFIADYASQTLRSRESILIDESSDPPLRPGKYFIAVIDQITLEFEAPFGIVASFSETMPESIVDLPTLDLATTDLDRALLATVEVLTDVASGSGVLLSDRGHVITNYHVIEDQSGRPSEDLYVALNVDVRRPPKELFRARVLESSAERDLALIQISGDLGGTALPSEFRFPFLELADLDEISMGEEMAVIGYPGIGGTGSRATITYTRGIVSGFQTTALGTIIKTDALINEGNSGGAGLNDRFELVGLPTLIIGATGGALGYLHSVDMIPPAWLELMNGDE